MYVRVVSTFAAACRCVVVLWCSVFQLYQSVHILMRGSRNHLFSIAVFMKHNNVETRNRFEEEYMFKHADCLCDGTHIHTQYIQTKQRHMILYF